MLLRVHSVQASSFITLALDCITNKLPLTPINTLNYKNTYSSSACNQTEDDFLYCQKHSGYQSAVYKEIYEWHQQKKLSNQLVIVWQVTHKVTNVTRVLTTSCECRLRRASMLCTTLVRSRQSIQFVRNTPSWRLTTIPSRVIMKYLKHLSVPAIVKCMCSKHNSLHRSTMHQNLTSVMSQLTQTCPDQQPHAQWAHSVAASSSSYTPRGNQKLHTCTSTNIAATSYFTQAANNHIPILTFHSTEACRQCLIAFHYFQSTNKQSSCIEEKSLPANPYTLANAKMTTI